MDLDVKLLDIVLGSSPKAVLLVSYAGVNDENSMMTVSNNPRRVCVLVSFSRTPNAFVVAEDVSYQSVSVFLTRVPSGTHSPIQIGNYRSTCSRFAAVTCRRCLRSHGVLELRNSTTAKYQNTALGATLEPSRTLTIPSITEATSK